MKALITVEKTGGSVKIGKATCQGKVTIVRFLGIKIFAKLQHY